jgi:hypothetical protein
MSRQITLPKSKATVTLRDATTLKQKDRKRLYNEKEDDTLSTYHRGMQLISNAIAIMVEDWSLDLLIPSVKIDSLDELEIDDFDFLQDEATKFMEDLFPKLAKTIENETNPESPLDKSKG